MTIQNRIYQSQINGLQENTGSGYQKLTPDEILDLYKKQKKRRDKVVPIQNPPESPWFAPGFLQRPEGGEPFGDDVTIRDPDHTRNPVWMYKDPNDPNPTVGGMPWHQYYLDPNAPLPQPEKEGIVLWKDGSITYSSGAQGGAQP
jgi:hypothetical protein